MANDSEDRLTPTWSRSPRRSARLIASPIKSFMAWEAAGGVALLLATVVALIWANVDTGSYESFWSTPITIGWGDYTLNTYLAAAVNDGLMTLFFLLIGLEVKRELAVGELSDRRAAAVPFAAALGGMVLPALIFLAFAAGTPAQDGWGIPMATDVAFALAVLAALKSRVPASLWAFLLGVAVIDDIGAIIVIAVAYSGGIEALWLGMAIVVLVLMWALTRMHVHAGIPYIALGILAWAFTAASGVHATIAGVAIGLLMPAVPLQRPAAVSAAAHRLADGTSDDPGTPDADSHAWLRLGELSREAVSPLTRTVHALHPWSSFVILPIFALANAGIVFGRDAFSTEGSLAAALGITLGLLVGKAVGIPLGAWLAVRSGLGRMPRDARWVQITGIGLVAGIGFTVSLFITDLAFSDPAIQTAARIGVLGGSVLAAISGALLLFASGRRR
ncbi:MAG: Na+/H+ antiporter NhaA [Thermoleophilia bacterium]|nr:Na+/H+ antiporter NhaA [Thermoleophilia bacterium]